MLCTRTAFCTSPASQRESATFGGLNVQGERAGRNVAHLVDLLGLEHVLHNFVVGDVFIFVLRAHLDPVHR